MEFQKKVIAGTEEYPHTIYVGELPHDIEATVNQAAANGKEYVEDYLVAESGYKRDVAGAVIDNADKDNVYWFLRHDANAYQFDELRLHYAEITGDPYVVVSSEESADDVRVEYGIDAIKDYEMSDSYLESQIERALEDLRRKMHIGKVALTACKPEIFTDGLLTQSESEELRSGGFYFETVIEQMEHNLAADIAEIYKAEVAMIDSDAYQYDEMTATALCKDRAFAATKGMVGLLADKEMLNEHEVETLLWVMDLNKKDDE